MPLGGLGLGRTQRVRGGRCFPSEDVPVCGAVFKVSASLASECVCVV
jgi:hypothetical protein